MKTDGLHLTVAEAMKLCREKHGKLPRLGHEMLADTRVRTVAVITDVGGYEWIEGWVGQQFHTQRPRVITTYLVNEAGSFHVREHSAVPEAR